MWSNSNFFLIEEIVWPFLWFTSNLLACTQRFEFLAAPDRPRADAKIPKVGENLKGPSLGLRHRLTRVPK